jgi:hypothetical protein
MSRSGRADNAAVSTVGGDASDIIELQRLAGNRAVAQLVADAPATGVDTGSRVDLLQLAIKIKPFPLGFAIGLDKVAEALIDLAPQDGRAIKAEYKRRTGWDLEWVITAQQGLGEDSQELPNNLGQADRKRLLNLLGGTVASVAPGAEGAPSEAAARDVAETTANRLRAEAAAVRKAIEKKQGEAAIELIRRPHAERQALADHYQTQYGESLYNALGRLSGRDAQRAHALWIDDTVTADRLALEGDLERQASADAEARKFAELADAFPAVGQVYKQRQRAARAAVESRLEGVAAGDQPGTTGGPAQGREHLAAVLAQPGTSDQTLATRLGAASDPVVAAIVDRGEPEQLAARLARADVEGTLKAADLAGGLQHLRALARRAAIREIEHQPAALAPQADNVISILTDGYYRRFADEFDKVDTKRPLAKVLASVGGAVERERNQALLAGKGALPAWQEMDLALRSRPRDMAAVRGILGRLDHQEVQALAEEYRLNTAGHRSMEADLMGTGAERQVAHLLDEDEARAADMEKSVLLQGGVFSSDATDEVTRLDEERKWTFGRYLALERAVMENRGTFAEVRDWVGNLEHELVERAHGAAADASAAMARALTDSPPDVAAARVALVQLQQAVERLDRNVGIYKEATKAAFEEFVDLAVLVVTTAVTLGQGSAIVLALRSTVATIGTKLVLKGSAYSVDEFLMDLRSGLGAAAGGKLVEGVLNPVAKQIAAYADKVKLSSSFAGRVAERLGPAAAWEAEHLITTGTSNLATGQDLGSGMGLEGQANALVQHGVTTAGKEMIGSRRRPTGHAGEEGATGPSPRPLEVAEAHPEAPGRSEATGPGPKGPDESVDGGPAELPPVPMGLPEAGRRSGSDEPVTRRPLETGSEESDTPPEREAVRDDDDWADDTREDIPVAENDRQRYNREQQELRARRNPSDFDSMRESTSPNTQSRAFARDLAPLHADWPELHPVERLERLEAVMNGPLAAAGSPRVFVEMSADLKPGKAAFDVETWKVTVSEEVLTSKHLTPEQFALLADHIAHEGRHALHHFRGLRMADAQGLPTTSARLQPAERAVRAAEAANAGTLDAEPMDVEAPAFREARDVFQQTFGPGAEHRLAVRATLKSAKKKVEEAQAAVDAASEGTGERSAAEEALRSANRRASEAHNDYMALPQETDAWRRGLGTRAAMLQELKAQQVRSLWQARGRAATAVRRTRRRAAALESQGGERLARAQARADEAVRSYRETQEQLLAARRELQELQDATHGATLRERESARERDRIRARRKAGAAT